MRMLSSNKRGLVGGSNVGRSPAPARTTLTGAGTYLRGTGLSPELRFPVIVFFLRGNVGRSWQLCGTRFNGEQVFIGADARLQAPAPAKASFIGAGAFLRGTGLSPELRFPVINFLR